MTKKQVYVIKKYVNSHKIIQLIDNQLITM